MANEASGEVVLRAVLKRLLGRMEMSERNAGAYAGRGSLTEDRALTRAEAYECAVSDVVAVARDAGLVVGELTGDEWLLLGFLDRRRTTSGYVSAFSAPELSGVREPDLVACARRLRLLGLVDDDPSHWAITDAGRAYLAHAPLAKCGR